MANTLTMKPVQRALCCPCGSMRIHARGLCASCLALNRRNEVYFGGLRETVLARDRHRCRCCLAARQGRRTIAVHHRRAGVSRLHLMITLCPGCHARVERTKVVRKEMTPLLLVLWQEQHPKGHEQLLLNFNGKPPQTVSAPLLDMGLRVS